MPPMVAAYAFGSERVQTFVGLCLFISSVCSVAQIPNRKLLTPRLYMGSSLNQGPLSGPQIL